MRVLLAACVVLIALVVGALFAAPFLIDAENYRDDISSRAEATIGQPVRIGGDVAFRLLPTPRLRVEQLSVGRAEGDALPPLLQAAAADIRLSLTALLSGDLVARKVVLIDPQITLATALNGRTNHGDWVTALRRDGPGATSGETRGTSFRRSATETNGDGLRLAQLSLQRIEFRGGVLNWRNDQAERQMRLDGLAGVLQIGSPESGDSDVPPGMQSLDLTAEGIAFGRRGPRQPADITFSARGSLDKSRVTASATLPRQGTVSLRGTLLSRIAGRDDATAPWFTGQVQADLSDATGLTALLPADDRTPTTNPDGEPAAGLGLPLGLAGDLSLRGHQADLTSLKVRMDGEEAQGRLSVDPGDLARAREPVIDLALAFEQANGDRFLNWLAGNVRRDGGAGLHRIATALFAPGNALRANIRMDAGLIALGGSFLRQAALEAAFDDETLTVRRLSALLPGGSDMAFTGKLRMPGGHPRLDGSLEAASDNLRALIGWAGLEAPENARDRLRNAGLTAAVSITDDVIQAYQIDLRLDRSRINGGMAVAWRRRPSFSLDLQVDRLNADAYLTAFGLNADNTATDGQAASPPAAGPVPDLSFLDRFDTNSTIAVGNLIVGGHVLTDTRLQASLLRGALSVQELTVANVAGMALTLSGSIDAPADPRLSGRLTLNGKAAGRFFSEFGLQGAAMAARIGRLSADVGFDGDLQRQQIDLTATTDIGTLGLQGQVPLPWAQPDSTDDRPDLHLTLTDGRLSRVFDVLNPGWRWPATLDSGLIADLDLTTATGDGDNADQLAVRGHLDALDGRLEVEGYLGLPAPATGATTGTSWNWRGDWRFRHADLRTLLKADATAGQSPPRPLTADGQVELGADHVIVPSFRIVSEPLAVAGTFGARLSGPRPLLDLTFQDLTLQLDGFLPPWTTGAKVVARTGETVRRWSRAPLDLPWLDAVDMSADGTFHTVVTDGATLANGRLKTRLNDGTLNLEYLAAETLGGRLQMAGHLTQQARTDLQATMQLDGVDLAELSDLALATRPLAGQGSASLILSATGLAPYDLVRNAAGQVNLTAENLTIDGFDLAALGDPATERDWREGQSAFGATTADLTLSAGRLRPAAPVLLSGADGTARISGNVDLADWQVDMQLDLTAAGATARVGLAGALQAPHRIDGTVRRPVITPAETTVETTVGTTPETPPAEPATGPASAPEANPAAPPTGN